MDSLFLQFIIFAISLAVLIYSADRFIFAAEQIGLKLGIPNFVIGVTIVALGTSLPELVSSIVAIYKDQSEIVIGNILGSNITNILLILGCTGLIARGFYISFNFKRIDLPFFIIASAYLLYACSDYNFTITEAIIGLVILVVYIMATIRMGNKASENLDSEDPEPTNYGIMTYVWLVLGAVGIYLGAKYNIGSVISISETLNVPSSVIALTAIALGTSLPELFVSIAAIRKGNAEIAVGNVLGSNTFNSLAIMGIPRFFGALDIPGHVYPSMVIMAVSSIFFIWIVWDKKLSLFEAILALCGYGIFLFLSIQGSDFS